MLHPTRGIVLRTARYSETSVIANIYTEQFGRQAFFINGIRTPKSKNKPALLQPLSLLHLIGYFREGRNFQRIREMSFDHVFQSLPFSTSKSAVGLFMAEVMLNSLREETANPDLFEFLHGSVLTLDGMPEPVRSFHLTFLIGLSRHLGFQPSAGAGSEGPFFDLRDGRFMVSEPVHAEYLSGDHTGLLRRLIGSDYVKAESMKMTRTERRGMVEHLLRFYALHLPDFREVRAGKIYSEMLM